MRQLSLRQIHGYRTYPNIRERDRPLRRAAAQLENLFPIDVAEDAQRALRDPPNTPLHRVVAQLGMMVALVPVGRLIPCRAVDARVVRSWLIGRHPFVHPNPLSTTDLNALATPE